MKIEYHRTTYDRRRRAGFWLGAGSFLASALSGYIALCIVGAVVILAFIIKFLRLFF